MTATVKLIATGIFGTTAFAPPVTAVPVVYTTAAAFSAANRDAVTFSQSYSAGVTSETPSFSVGPVTFRSAGLNAYNDGSLGAGVSYLGAVLANSLII